MDLTFTGVRWFWPWGRKTGTSPAGDGKAHVRGRVAIQEVAQQQAARSAADDRGLDEGDRVAGAKTAASKRQRGRRAPRAGATGADVTASVEALAPEGPSGPEVVAGEEAGHVRTGRTYAREASALVLIALGLYVALALASFRCDPMRPDVVGDNWVGPVGAMLASFFANQIGVVSWFLPLECLVIAAPLLADRPLKLGIWWLSGDVLLAVTGSALLQIAGPEVHAFGAIAVGGVVGQLFGELARGLFSDVGSYLVGSTVIGLILVRRATFSFIELAQRVQAWSRRARGRLGQGLGNVAGAWQQARDEERKLAEQEREASEPLIASPEQADAIIAALADDGSPAGNAGGLLSWDVPTAVGRPSVTDPELDVDSRVPTVRVVAREPEEPPAPPTNRSAGLPLVQGGQALVGPTGVVAAPPAPPAPGADAASERETPSPTPSMSAGSTSDASQLLVDALDSSRPSARASTRGEEPQPNGEGTAAPRRRGRKAKVEEGPRIVDTTAAARTDPSGKRRAVVDKVARHRLPTTDLLEPRRERDVQIDREALRQTAELLEKTLADYGVTGKVMEILPGPTVTTFEVAPAPGTKVSKVAGLADDLALGLSCKVRIVAPIPGKNRVGFEVPNEFRSPVNLRELIEDRRFLDMKAPLPCVLGRDIVGTPVFADLASMPHVIVAGATGAGKSVGLAVMLISLLYRRTPAELRLLLVDPKVVELAPFDRIPHLLLPVVTDMKQAANALKWAVDEMERRYQLFANVGTRNVKGYNGWVKRVQEGKVERGPTHEMHEAIAPDGTSTEVPPDKEGRDALPLEPLPYIVVVVDEFADLMMQQGKDVEMAVARLAQKARAAGIHVILATQRPSVDVITGMIKANFPTRIGFRVAQKVDSRTILDEQGAEHLLGKGDMLVKLNGASDTKRVQCPFCSEEEVQSVTDMLRAQGEPQYDESIVKARDEDDEGASAEDAEGDPLYDQAVRIVADTRRCSTSWIQRKLGIGYNRAAKIVETMERKGIIGPPNGSKEREILITAM